MPTALNRPNTLALDLTTAKKIFGDINPVGEVLVLDSRTDYVVTAVYEDLPQNSHFNHNILLSMTSFQWTQNNNWLSTNFNTYIKLEEGAIASGLEAKFPGMIETYCAPMIEQFLNMNMKEFGEAGNALGYSLFPLKDIHLYSDKDEELEANGDIKYVYIFAAVALFILALACINFMNLSTARSSNRAKEVGVRKVMGAFRRQLIYQFMSEAILISFISFILSYVLVFTAIPAFNAIAEKELAYLSLIAPGYLAFMLGIMLVVGLLAGSYPALYLSMFKPVEVLKGKIRQGIKSGPIRSTLVVFQFSISIIMIIGTAIVFDQLSFIQNKKLGYDKDQILMINDAWILRDQVNAFKEEVARNSNVLSSTASGFTPTSNYNNTDLYFKNQSVQTDESLVIRQTSIDRDFLSTLGIEVLQGRGFSKEFSDDSSAVLLNETAARQFGYEEAVGSKIYAYGGDNDNPIVEGYRIVGVVKDFHYESLKNNISPIVFHFGQSNGVVMLKIQMENAQETIDFVQAKWDEFAPGQPFDFRFMNNEFNAQYNQEQKIGQIFTVFAVLAVVIACLGLFGLAAFTAEQKTKEIGIRKTLGASVSGIVNMLSMSFIKLVLLSFLVAIPISYLAMDYWLEDFAYRTSLSFTTFLFSGLGAIFIAWITISFQSWKAAKVNPVQSLRSE